MTSTTSSEATTTLLFEATVDEVVEVVVEEEDQEEEEEEEEEEEVGGVKEVKDEETEVPTKTAGLRPNLSSILYEVMITGAPVWVGWVVAILCLSLLFTACIIYIRQV